jgi:molybdate transport system permease protein
VSPLALSLGAAGVATLLAALIGVALAWALASRRFIGRDLIDALVTAPMVLPPTVLGYYVLVACGRDSVIGDAWESLFGEPLVFSRSGVVLAAFLGALPMVVRSSRAALEAVDPMLVAVARTLGAGRWRAFVTVHLPLAARGVAAGCMLGFARALGDFGVTLMVAGNLPGETQTASLAIYDAIAAGDDHRAAGLALLLSGVGLCILYVATKLVGRRFGGGRR